MEGGSRSHAWLAGCRGPGANNDSQGKCFIFCLHFETVEDRTAGVAAFIVLNIGPLLHHAGCSEVKPKQRPKRAGCKRYFCDVI